MGRCHPPDDREHTIALWQRALAARGIYEVEHRVRRHDGTYHYYWARGIPVLERDGSIREWVGIHTDIDDRKRAEQERERLIQALAHSNQDLDQFAYVASHDLKAPLRGISNLAQWIEEDLGDKMTDEAREQMAMLRGRVHRMERSSTVSSTIRAPGGCAIGPSWSTRASCCARSSRCSPRHRT